MRNIAVVFLLSVRVSLHYCRDVAASICLLHSVHNSELFDCFVLFYIRQATVLIGHWRSRTAVKLEIQFWQHNILNIHIQHTLKPFSQKTINQLHWLILSLHRSLLHAAFVTLQPGTSPFITSYLVPVQGRDKKGSAGRTAGWIAWCRLLLHLWNKSDECKELWCLPLNSLITTWLFYLASSHAFTIHIWNFGP